MINSIVTMIKDLNGLEALMYLLVIILASKMGYNDIIKKVFKINTNNFSPSTTKHVIMLAEIDKLISEKLNIQNIRILKDQMREVETTLDTVTREMKDSVFKELVKNGLEAAEILENITYKHYSACAEILYIRVSRDIKYMLKENGLHIKNETDMRNYLQTRFDKLVDTASRVFNVYYCGSELKITRIELHNLHLDSMTRFKQQFEDTIRSCREIDIKYHKMIDEIDSRLEYLKSSPCGDCK